MRPEKTSIVSDLSEKLKSSPFVLVADYQRMKVGDFGELRNRLAPTGAEVHVVKNNFLKRAMADSGFPDVSDKLIGQTAVVTGQKDVAPIAKIFKKFSAEFKIAALKIGLVDRSILSAAELETLADLPTREVLLSQFLGLLMAPATKFVRVLNEPASAFARLLSAKAKSMPAEPAKAAEPAKPVAAVTEAPATAEASAPAEAPPVAEAPVATEAPAPAAVETPAVAEVPAVTEAPAAPEAPVVAETPAVEAPAAAEPKEEEKPPTEGAT
jgi:large subunit ribosomal protein L10